MSKKKRKKSKPQKKQAPKKSKSKAAQTQFLPKRHVKKLEQYYEEKNWESLFLSLAELQIEFPKAPEIYALKTLAGRELKLDDVVYHSAYHWARLAPSHPDALLIWSEVALENMQIGHAIRSLQQFLYYWPTHESADSILEQLEQIREVFWEEIAEQFGLSGTEDALQLMCWYEDAQLALEEERFEEAISYGHKITARIPEHTAAKNTIGLALFACGRVDDAIETLKEILLIAPDNFHALANSIHFLMLQNKREEAGFLVQKLKEVTSSRKDVWVKKIEGFCFFGDFSAVLDCVEALKLSCEDPESEPFEELSFAANVCHLAGVASTQEGADEEARKWFKQAHKLQPELKVAERNLDELYKPRHERFSPWAFSLAIWLPLRLFYALGNFLSRLKEENDEQSKSALTQSFLDKHPLLRKALPVLLHNAGPEGNTLICQILLAEGSSQSLEELAHFVQSDEGPDSIRADFLQALIKKGQFSRGSKLTLHHKGKQKEQLLLDYSIDETSPALPESLKEQILELRSLLNNRELNKAKERLEQIKKIEPTHLETRKLEVFFADLEKDTETVKTLCLQIIEQQPEHIWAQLRLAQLALEYKQFKEANKWFVSVSVHPKFQKQELQMLCELGVELQLREKEQELALQWLGLADKLELSQTFKRKMQKKFSFWGSVKRRFGR